MFLIFPHFHNLLQNLKFWDFLPKVHCLSTPHSHSTIPCHVRKIFIFQFCGNTPVKCLRKNYFVTVNKYKCIVHRCFVRTIFKKIKWYVHVYCWVITWGPKSPGPSPKVKANASETHTHTHTHHLNLQGKKIKYIDSHFPFYLHHMRAKNIHWYLVIQPWKFAGIWSGCEEDFRCGRPSFDLRLNSWGRL